MKYNLKNFAIIHPLRRAGGMAMTVKTIKSFELWLKDNYPGLVNSFKELLQGSGVTGESESYRLLNALGFYGDKYDPVRDACYEFLFS